jgi:hypothetical protein
VDYLLVAGCNYLELHQCKNVPAKILGTYLVLNFIEDSDTSQISAGWEAQRRIEFTDSTGLIEVKDSQPKTELLHFLRCNSLRSIQAQKIERIQISQCFSLEEIVLGNVKTFAIVGVDAPQLHVHIEKTQNFQAETVCLGGLYIGDCSNRCSISNTRVYQKNLTLNSDSQGEGIFAINNLLGVEDLIINGSFYEARLDTISAHQVVVGRLQKLLVQRNDFLLSVQVEKAQEITASDCSRLQKLELNQMCRFGSLTNLPSLMEISPNFSIDSLHVARVRPAGRFKNIDIFKFRNDFFYNQSGVMTLVKKSPNTHLLYKKRLRRKVQMYLESLEGNANV